MAYTQNPGRGPMQKTGRGLPEGFKQIDPTDLLVERKPLNFLKEVKLLI